MTRTFVEKLATARRNKKCGNHEVFHIVDEPQWHLSGDEQPEKVYKMFVTRAFYYHGHLICAVNDFSNKVWMTHSGWWTVSTKNALAGYREWFVRNQGYEWVNQFPIYQYETK